jgi:4'-phosphopantetheinyl transferase
MKDTVTVFILDIRKFIKNTDIFLRYLSYDEKIRAKTYDKSLSKRYIVVRGILRIILGHYIKLNPQKIEFFYNEYGKPFLKGNKVQFNLSYSHNMVSYVINETHRVGIDIELHRNDIDVMSISSLVFTTIEFKHLNSLKEKEKINFFYEVWSKKESLIKAIGIGLSYPINTIETLSDPYKCQFEIENVIWYLYKVKSPKKYSSFISIDHKIKTLIQYNNLNSLQINK